MRISTDEVECPSCGSADVVALKTAYGVYRCLECREHFEEQEEAPPPPRSHNRRKLRQNIYREDDE